MPLAFVMVATLEKRLKGVDMHRWDEPATAYK
jgi:hypothetical protein